ncbi:tetratricopeptide repeat protein [Streptosporangiaceae bacterium NEAU-GS5]|nr:tetratricopeptide repeat protein [Streptosporangiaceae bacterium NEAU-GS5]
MSDPATFGARLRARRIERGMSLSRLALAVHYSKSYLSKIENDRMPPTVALAALCDELLEAGGELLALAGRSTPPVSVRAPWWLGAGPHRFGGRARELAELDQALDQPGPAVTVVSGAPGVGKTALLLEWGRRVASRFGDGVLSADLRAYTGGVPPSTGEVLSGLLRDLGVPPHRLPKDPGEAARLYHELTAGRAILLVLDNAARADQVRPLILRGAGSATVIASRNRLTGLVATDRVRWFELGALPRQESVGVLAELTEGGHAPIPADQLEELAAACGDLPLALRIAAAQLLTSARRDARRLARQIRGSEGVAALAVEGDDSAAVGVAFDQSLQVLDEETQLVFMAMGLPCVVHLTGALAGVAAGIEPGRAARCLARLHDAHLLEQRVDGRYTCHDLLRSHARARVGRLPDAWRESAVRRLLDHLTASARAAAEILHPQMTRLDLPSGAPAETPVEAFERPDAAARWLDDELAGLLAAIRDAAGRRPPDPAAWLIADALRGWFYQNHRGDAWERASRDGLAAAESRGDATAICAMRASLGLEAKCAGRYQDAESEYGEALRFARLAGWRVGEAAILGNLGAVRYEVGRFDEAFELYQASLRLNQAEGNHAGESVRLGNLGGIYRHKGDFERAAECYLKAFELYERIGSYSGQVLMMVNMANLAIDAGDVEEAVAYGAKALALPATSLVGTCLVHGVLARANAARGDAAAALALAGQSLSDSRRARDPRLMVDAHISMAIALRAGGQRKRAAGQARVALTRAHDIGYHDGYLHALKILSG